MANHKSTIRQIHKNQKRRLLNRSQHKSARTAIKNLILEINKLGSSNSNSTEAQKELFLQYSKVSSRCDKLAKKNVIHSNKASRIKSKLRNKIDQLSSKLSSETPKSKEKEGK